MLNLFALFLLSVCALLIEAQEPIVTTAQGQVQGKTKTSVKGRPFSEFLGIPFAQPPEGKLRFAAPVTPAASWAGVLDASINGPLCPQTLAADVVVLGEEDCLYLNVYTPKLADGLTQLPVIVWIYGGGYSRGGEQSYVYGPERYMDKDVVLVSVAYRVGPFGFLSTLDAAASGNFGLLDQLAGLKWVQENVAAFGGDPNQVTIQGESAGSTSVSFQVLSPAAAGLFHAAIGESGSALCSWSVQKDPMNFTLRMAIDLECPTTDTQELVDCLRNRTVDELVNAAWKLGDYNVDRQPFVPVVENPAVGLFLTEYPWDILNAGTFNKVPYLTGCNHDEGVIIYEITPGMFDPIDDHFYNEVLPLVVYGIFKYDHNLINVSYAIKAEYYDKIDVNDSNAVIKTTLDMLTDGVFLAPNDAYVKKIASYGLPVYTYIFAYTGGSSTHHYANYTQVSHGDELFYIFKFPGFPLKQDDQELSDQLIEMWTNFAITHNPTPSGPITWSQVSPSDPQYLYILAPAQTAMVDNYRSEQMYFWNHIVTEILVE